MRSIPCLLAPFLVAALAAASAAEANPAAAGAPTLILFSGLGFQGRQAFYSGERTQEVRPGFQARSAVSTGIWTLCDGRSASSRCQTVSGASARLKLEPRIVRPGVNAIALYEKPGLRGRRVIYSFASDRPPPFRARSARTWGGAWSLCPAGSGRCETIQGERADLDLQVAAIRPGRAPEGLQIVAAEASPRPTPPTEPRAPAPRARSPAITALARNERVPPPARGAPAPIPLPPLPEAYPQSAEPFAYEPPPPARPARAPMLAQASPPPAPRVRPAGPRQVDYACEDGRSLIVVFDPRNGTAEVLSQDEDPVVLDRMNAPRGFRYESFDRAFYGERTEATYEDRDGEPVDCRAVQPRRAYGEP